MRIVRIFTAEVILRLGSLFELLGAETGNVLEDRESSVRRRRDG
jgi:hypothetical protein